MTDKADNRVIKPPPGGSVSFHEMAPQPAAGAAAVPVQGQQAGPAVQIIPGQQPPATVAQAGPVDPPGAEESAVPPEGAEGANEPSDLVEPEMIEEDTRAMMEYARHAGTPLSIEIRGTATIISAGPVTVEHAEDPETGQSMVHVTPADRADDPSETDIDGIEEKTD